VSGHWLFHADQLTLAFQPVQEVPQITVFHICKL
jgi:hypothetical protein